jgi:hypothetical protein
MMDVVIIHIVDVTAGINNKRFPGKKSVAVVAKARVETV